MNIQGRNQMKNAIINNKKGYTSIELGVVIAGCISIVLACCLIYTGVHFLMKFW